VGTFAVQSLGADRVIDYTREDFTKSGQRYDLILDNVGNHSLSALRGVLNPKGICVIAGAPKNPSGFVLTHIVAAPVLSRFVSQRFLTFIAKMNKEDLTIIRELMATGKVKPVIDKHYRLGELRKGLKLNCAVLGASMRRRSRSDASFSRAPAFRSYSYPPTALRTVCGEQLLLPPPRSLPTGRCR
jgi:hypothetical protein